MTRIGRGTVRWAGQLTGSPICRSNWLMAGRDVGSDTRRRAGASAGEHMSFAVDVLMRMSVARVMGAHATLLVGSETLGLTFNHVGFRAVSHIEHRTDCTLGIPIGIMALLMA
jgi:hypothetical protein